jgi:hypothetical protein
VVVTVLNNRLHTQSSISYSLRAHDSILRQCRCPSMLMAVRLATIRGCGRKDWGDKNRDRE